MNRGGGSEGNIKLGTGAQEVNVMDVNIIINSKAITIK